MRNWALSDLVVRTSKVELRWPTLDDLDDLADCAADGVHPPDFMPFFSQWTDGDRETVTHRVLQRQWNSQAFWRPEEWTLYLVVVADGKVVGSQSVGARDFAITREVLLTSWMGLRYQGRGLGTHARAAMLELSFIGLGAEHAFCVVRQGNKPSQSVCRRFNFAHDGTQINVVRGERIVSDRYRLSRPAWLATRPFPAGLDGVERALPMFGLPRSEPVPAPVAGSVELLSGVRYAPEGDLCTD
jgi:RimJ/RimL family protein N-acetyltransferase